MTVICLVCRDSLSQRGYGRASFCIAHHVYLAPMAPRAHRTAGQCSRAPAVTHTFGKQYEQCLAPTSILRIAQKNEHTTSASSDKCFPLCIRTRIPAAVETGKAARGGGGGLIVYAVASHRVDSQWRYALALQNQCSVVRFPQGVTRVYLSFFLGRSWLVWPHFFLRQLTARGCRRA